ncbi:unnamed protein product [Orchesella dallaii]|uniref:C2 domain-containing protein n=1 Tax=Orchesella dallaii TaxID=48710 RepID=A0ABP1R1T2_9HEXA
MNAVRLVELLLVLVACCDTCHQNNSTRVDRAKLYFKVSARNLERSYQPVYRPYVYVDVTEDNGKTLEFVGQSEYAPSCSEDPQWNKTFFLSFNRTKNQHDNGTRTKLGETESYSLSNMSKMKDVYSVHYDPYLNERLYFEVNGSDGYRGHPCFLVNDYVGWGQKKMLTLKNGGWLVGEEEFRLILEQSGGSSQVTIFKLPSVTSYNQSRVQLSVPSYPKWMP